MSYLHVGFRFTWILENVLCLRSTVLQVYIRRLITKLLLIIIIQWIQISQTLNFLNLPITWTTSLFPSSATYCNFTPNFSSSPIFRTNFHFAWRFKKSGFHCNRKWHAIGRLTICLFHLSHVSKSISLNFKR